MIVRTGGDTWRFADWLKITGPIIIFLVGQTIAALIMGATLLHRVDVIEQRGSPGVAALERRVSANEQWEANHDKKAAETHLTTRLAEHERRLAVIEEHDKTVLDILKQNAALLMKLNDELTKHMIDERQRR